MKEYYELILNVPDESREALGNKITEMGSLGSFERNRDIVAYFDYEADISQLCEELNSFRDVLKSSGLDSSFSFDYALLPERDWNEAWKKNFQPFDVGSNLTIIPSRVKHDTERIPLVIDPGMAFGTGLHETTKACIMLIERVSRGKAGKSFLDVGTGTGILAICAARVGFEQVTAVDTDEVAVEAAMNNVGLNGLDNIEVKKGSIYDVEGTFDIIVANLTLHALIRIADPLEVKLNARGTAILSGMIEGQALEVIEVMGNAGLTLKEKVIEGKWVTLVLVPQSNSAAVP